ncbi:MAG: Fic family protein, partial [Gemmatimonadetes bacterium]|nr:Fic family protein [Gemmatimonadota bacterium]
MAAANILPLMLDKKLGAFSYNLTKPIPERLHEIDLRAGGRIEMPSQVTNPETRDRYYIESQIEEAITSSQLEGASTTRRVAKQLIRSGRRPRGRSETMIFNNYLTMKLIVELKTEKMTPELVLHIHENVTRNTLDDPTAAGRIRKSSEDIYVADREDQVIHRPPHADT